MILFNLIIFIFGTIIGSFLNVLIYRIPRGIGFVKGRSFCPKCKKQIKWFDNIPLFSFVILGGKCRNCKKSISLRYPLIEFITGILTVLIINNQLSIIKQYSIINFQTFFDFGSSLLVVYGLVVIFFIDLEHFIIPDEIVFPLIGISLLNNLYRFRLASSAARLAGMTGINILIATNILPAILSFLFFYFLYLITKHKGMGFGDVKLAFLMGLLLGYPGIVLALYISFLTGAFFGVILILRKKAKAKSKVPFGPFLSGAAIIVFLWGEKILLKVLQFLN